VPDCINRVYRTEPAARPTSPTRLTVAGPEFCVTRDAVLTLLTPGLVHCDHLVRIDPARSLTPSNRAGEQCTAYVLTATRHGRDALDVAHRIGRLPHPPSKHGRHSPRGRKGTQ
jgi:hypothetical protein